MNKINEQSGISPLSTFTELESYLSKTEKKGCTILNPTTETMTNFILGQETIKIILDEDRSIEMTRIKGWYLVEVDKVEVYKVFGQYLTRQGDSKEPTHCELSIVISQPQTLFP